MQTTPTAVCGFRRNAANSPRPHSLQVSLGCNPSYESDFAQLEAFREWRKGGNRIVFQETSSWRSDSPLRRRTTFGESMIVRSPETSHFTRFLRLDLSGRPISAVLTLSSRWTHRLREARRHEDKSVLPEDRRILQRHPHVSTGQGPATITVVMGPFSCSGSNSSLATLHEHGRNGKLTHHTQRRTKDEKEASDGGGLMLMSPGRLSTFFSGAGRRSAWDPWTGDSRRRRKQSPHKGTKWRGSTTR
uniref:Uncharacterized protein n=1 Tax=Steinernema glaseri TaxID=37863 RepID=A0A1I7ZYM2_9BILA